MQIKYVDDDLRIAIWNIFYKHYNHNLSTDNEIGFSRYELFDQIWCDFLIQTADTMPRDENVFLSKLKDSYFKTTSGNVSFGLVPGNYVWEWNKVYDFLEFLSEFDKNQSRQKKFQDGCNEIFEKEYCGYRFINNLIVPITSDEEIVEIETAIQQSTKEIQIHLNQALIHLSDRQVPDYRNSIKESISAVEAQCKIVVDDSTTTLGRALEKISKGNQIVIHPSLKEAFQKLYSWTNDDGGIRHALKDDSIIGQEEAQFMLIACSAFINYLQVKMIKSKSGEKIS